MTTTLSVILALILLPLIAFASPPDPSWVAGLYDGADGDDIVSLVCEASAANEAASSHIGPFPCLRELSLEGAAPRIPGRHLTIGSRAPPILHSSNFAYVSDSLPSPVSGTKVPFAPPSIFRQLPIAF